MNMKSSIKAHKFIVLSFISTLLLVGCTKELVTEPYPEGTINGVFSVGNDKKVFFSKGNLQYQASTDTWRFAESQFDVVGLDNKQISDSDTCWIDLFGWATSGFPHGSVCYQPWSSSGNAREYYAYELLGKCNLFDKTGQADWGYNAISNGGNTQNVWRTLKHEEWGFLLKERKTNSGLRFVKAEVDKVNGLVIFPDNWDSTLYKVNKPNEEESMYSDNMIFFSDWLMTFEYNGCVFLPAAGSRDELSVRNLNVSGNYWSSTCTDAYSAGVLSFDFLYLNVYPSGGSSATCRSGFSVRLVKDKK